MELVANWNWSSTISKLFYQPPMKRTFLWSIDDKEPIRTFCLNLPHLYFLINYTSALDSRDFWVLGSFIFGSSEKIEKLTDKVFAMPLPNVKYHGGICLGNGLKLYTSDSELIEKSIDRLYNASGNEDSVPVSVREYISRRTNYEFFQDLSKASPDIWKKLDTNIVIQNHVMPGIDFIFNSFEK